MNKVSLVLFILQILAIFGSVINGNLFTMGLLELIGFMLPTIIGIILQIRTNKKNKAK